MKKIVLLLVSCLALTFVYAQDTLVRKGPYTPVIVKNRSADHFMLQLSSDHWAGMPDSISSHKKGLSRGFSMYFMFNKQFKSAPKFSLGIGAGISTSNMYFEKMDIQLNSNSDKLPFLQADSLPHFKKYKLATSYLELPLEFRFTAKPDNINKSFKAAIGVKIGTLVNAHTKGKTLLDKNENTIGNYIGKVNSKRYINSARFMATARVGYGIFSLFGTYGLSNVLKDGVGPEMKLYQIGLTISGL